MKTVDQIRADIERRLANTWHTEASNAAGSSGSWPHTFPLGSPGNKAALQSEFGAIQRSSVTWRSWARAHDLTLTDTVRHVHGSPNPIPSYLQIPDVDTAARVVGNGWPDRLARGRSRAAELATRSPAVDTAAVVRVVDAYTDLDFALLLQAGAWFTDHSGQGRTPRQIPIPGMHAKWLNTRQSLVALLAGRDSLDLLPEHPARIHFTYLDPTHRAAGGRLHDSASVSDLFTPAYLPQVVLISENKDTAVGFPSVAGGLAVEGEGRGARTPASFEWLRTAPLLVYWGDMDSDGLEILHEYRDAGLPVRSMLMDVPTYERYEQFGTWTAPNGTRLPAASRRDLPLLTPEERELYERFTDPAWDRVCRIEQERIPLEVAAEALHRLRPVAG